MRKPPDPVKRGPKKLKDRYNELLEFAVASRIITVLGGTLAESPGGTALQINAPSNGAPTPPFQLIDASDEDGKKIGISNGTVTGPGWNALPDGMTPGGVPLYPLEVSAADKYAWIFVAWDTSGETPVITLVSLAVGPALPASSATAQYIPLGDFDASGTRIQIGSGAVGIGSQIVQNCSGVFLAGPI